MIIENNAPPSTLKRLGSLIQKNGFNYHLIARNEKYCLYSQLASTNTVIAYELFRHKVNKYADRMKKFALLNNKPFQDWEEFAEAFPSDEEFGVRAWTYRTLDEAMIRFSL